MAIATFRSEVESYASEFLTCNDFDLEYLQQAQFSVSGKIASGSDHVVMLFIGFIANDGIDNLESFVPNWRTFLNQCQMCGDLFEHTSIEQLCIKCQAEVMAYDLNDDPRDYTDEDREA